MKPICEMSMKLRSKIFRSTKEAQMNEPKYHGRQNIENLTCSILEGPPQRESALRIVEMV